MVEACGYRDHSESVNAIDSAGQQKPCQKIQDTTDPAVEDLRKQIKNLTEIVTKQENPSASIQSDIDVLRAQVKTLTDLVLSRNDNNKPAPPQFDKKIECFHCKSLGHTGKHCNWIGVGNDCIANHTILKRYVFHQDENLLPNYTCRNVDLFIQQ